MDPRRGNLQGAAAPGRDHGEAKALQPPLLQIFHPDAAPVGEATADGLAVRGQGVQQLVVPAQHRQSAGAQVLKDLRLGRQNIPAAAEVLQVYVVDVGDNRHVRPDGLTQPPDLARRVHAGLHHSRLVLRQQGQQGQRRADVAVEVPWSLEGVVPLGQNAREQLLEGGLAHAAGDLHHRQVKLPPVPPRQVPQGPLGVLHQDVGLAGQQRLRQAGAEAPRPAGLQGPADVVVAVKPLPGNGDKPVAGADAPAVGGEAGDDGGWVPIERTACGGAHLGGSHGDHGVPPVSGPGGPEDRYVVM